MARIRAENPGSPHKDMMGLLSKSYRERKASGLRDGSEDLVPRMGGLSVSKRDSIGEKESLGDAEDGEEEFFDANEGGVVDLVSDEEDGDGFWG